MTRPVVRQHAYRAIVALGVLCTATVARADTTAVYVEPDNNRFTIEISDNGDIRAQRSSEPYAVVILASGTHMVWFGDNPRVVRMDDLVAARGKAAPSSTNVFSKEPLGGRMIGKWRGSAYAMRSQSLSHNEILVLSSAVALRPLARAAQKLLDGFFQPMALTMEENKDAAYLAFQAMKEGIGREAPLVWSDMTLLSLEKSPISKRRFLLPTLP